MSSKKHLDGQGKGRRRTNRRRAVHLTEFLRGDDEPSVQVPVPQAESQNTTRSSIGTIPSTDLLASCVTVSPVVSPDEPEKVSQSPPPPPAPPMPLNFWQLSSGRNDPPQGTFVPDHKAFPGLGKQGKRCKPLGHPEANTATMTPDSAKARRVCPVLGNFLPESVLPEGAAAGKDRTVTCWLNSVPSAVDNCQSPEPASSSSSRVPVSKEATSQQPEMPCCSSQLNLSTQPKISHHKPASRVAVAAASVPPLEKEPSQQQQPQERPENSNENKLQQKSSAGPSKRKMPENPSARETEPIEGPASQFSTQDQRQNLSGNRSFWEESEDSSLEEQTEQQAGERQTAGSLLPPPMSRSSMNANAQEFRPLVREQEKNHQEQRLPGGGPSQQLPDTRLRRRRRYQRQHRAEKRRQHAHEYWEQIRENQQAQRLSAGQQLQEQSQDSVALPSCYYSAPAAHQGQQQQTAPVTQNQLYRDNQVYDAAPATPTFYGAPSSTPVYGGPSTSSAYGAPPSTPDYGAPPATPTFYEAPPTTPAYGAPPTTPAYVAVPANPAAVAPSSQIPITIQNNADVSQSVFRLASLPSTGVGTRNPMPPDISSMNQLPSSISGASQFTHTLSSLPAREENYPDCRRQQSNFSPDLFYTRSLLDMDREDTQEEVEEEEQASPQQQWGWQMNTNRVTDTEREKQREQPRHHHQAPVVSDSDAAVVPSARKPIFRSPSSHGEGYPKPDLNCVPANIKKLHRTITQRYSDYAFVYALVAQLGQECVPMDCYVYLKMILLASIVSIEPDELRPPISLCIISTDSLMANRLMNCIGQLAPRFLGPHEYGLQPTISGQLSSSRYAWVVASPLLLAQQGVYYAGDWTRLSKEQGEEIEKCIENGSVPVPQLQSDQALEAAIWTHWQPENSSNQTLAFAKLCPIFGMPIYMGGAAGSKSDSLWSFLLRQHSEAETDDDEQPDGLNIPEEDMRMLLHLLHQREITFEDDAQHMLQKYYVISRKERPTVFTSKTYIVLKQFAESFAKLALRLEVLESDVCLAIFHCEHFVQKIFGGTSPPPPAVNSFSVISHIDPYMNVFARWLMEYLDRYDDKELGMDKAKRRRTDSWDFL